MIVKSTLFLASYVAVALAGPLSSSSAASSVKAVSSVAVSRASAALLPSGTSLGLRRCRRPHLRTGPVSRVGSVHPVSATNVVSSLAVPASSLQATSRVLEERAAPSSLAVSSQAVSSRAVSSHALSSADALPTQGILHWWDICDCWEEEEEFDRSSFHRPPPSSGLSIGTKVATGVQAATSAPSAASLVRRESIVAVPSSVVASSARVSSGFATHVSSAPGGFPTGLPNLPMCPPKAKSSGAFPSVATAIPSVVASSVPGTSAKASSEVPVRSAT